MAGLRSGDGWFTTGAVNELFDAFRIPRPANTSAILGRLRDEDRFTILTDQGWSLTPLGQEQVIELVGELELARLLPQLAEVAGAEFGDALHTVISPTWAPIRWTAAVTSFLERYPFDTNVFCMTRFPKNEDDTEYLDPVEEVIDVARDVLDRHGLVLHLAFDQLILDDLFGNVAAHMWASKYGIGLLENRTEEGLNYNVITELGAMLMTGRRCALLRDVTAPDLPSDLAGHVYKSVDFDNPDQVGDELESWVIRDLRLHE